MGRGCMLPIVLVLALTIGLTVGISLIGCSDVAASGATGNTEVETTRVNFVVRGMVCDKCEAAITDAMNGVDSVEASSVSFVDGTATVELSDPTATAAILTSVRELGYEIERAD